MWRLGSCILAILVGLLDFCNAQFLPYSVDSGFFFPLVPGGQLPPVGWIRRRSGWLIGPETPPYFSQQNLFDIRGSTKRLSGSRNSAALGVTDYVNGDKTLEDAAETIQFSIPFRLEDLDHDPETRTVQVNNNMALVKLPESLTSSSTSSGAAVPAPVRRIRLVLLRNPDTGQIVGAAGLMVGDEEMEHKTDLEAEDVQREARRKKHGHKKHH